MNKKEKRIIGKKIDPEPQPIVGIENKAKIIRTIIIGIGVIFIAIAVIILIIKYK